MPSPVVNAAIAETVLLTYRGVKDSVNVDNPIPHFPLPSQFASVVLVYGVLSFAPARATNVAGMIGWGLVLATFLNLWKPGTNVTTTTALAAPTTT